MTLKQIFTQLNIPFAYSHFKKPVNPPYAVYLGNGQTTFGADNTWTYSRNLYRVEYYFAEKDESKEAAIESAFLNNGFNYTKSEDVYIENENIFVVYYEI